MNLNNQSVVLSGLLSYPQAWTEHCAELHGGLFSSGHAEVYRAIETLHTEGRVVDMVTVTERLGVEYNDLMLNIGEKWVSESMVGPYIGELQTEYNSGKARDIGAELAATGDGEAAQRALEGIAYTPARVSTSDAQTALRRLWDDVQSKVDQDFIGLETGLVELDKKLCGLVAGDLILLAGRPSTGKTALMLNIAQSAACPVGIFSLEMPTAKLMARMISAQGIDHGKLKRPKLLTPDDWQRMVTASAKVKDVYINDTGGLALNALESEARRMVKKHGVGLICIDYLQLVTCKAEKRLEVVSEVSRRLKALAKNLAVPVIALSQLNRQSEDRINPVMTLAQLRESGQLEQDADVVVFIDRPEIRDNTCRPGEADLIVAKNRDGEIGKVTVTWQGQYQRFVNFERDWYSRT